MPKSEQDGSPPLQARIQSSMCPGDRVSNCGGSTYSSSAPRAAANAFAASHGRHDPFVPMNTARCP